MPSVKKSGEVSWPEHKLMEAVAHNAEFAKKAGIPQRVGKDYAAADDAAGITKTHGGKPAKGVRGRARFTRSGAKAF